MNLPEPDGRDYKAAYDTERLRWIETWAQGWQRTVGDTTDYSLMPLDVATKMILELVEVVKYGPR